ncbi:MAG: rRNA maturation RNase YbeY [Cycloclasticus sp.]|nr:rRNA maturation RNase YbeY [Cycloclasticus sp.]
MSVEIQVASESASLPSETLFTDWVGLATKEREGADVVVRLVDEVESAELNQSYRQKDGATNVLSFPFELPSGLPEEALEDDILGDLVICAPIVFQEAKEQGKQPLNHWAHLVVHGCLHLQGYDHVKADDALVMEALEVSLLGSIGIDNPYEA